MAKLRVGCWNIERINLNTVIQAQGLLSSLIVSYGCDVLFILENKTSTARILEKLLNEVKQHTGSWNAESFPAGGYLYTQENILAIWNNSVQVTLALSAEKLQNLFKDAPFNAALNDGVLTSHYRLPLVFNILYKNSMGVTVATYHGPGPGNGFAAVVSTSQTAQSVLSNELVSGKNIGIILGDFNLDGNGSSGEVKRQGVKYEPGMLMGRGYAWIGNWKIGTTIHYPAINEAELTTHTRDRVYIHEKFAFTAYAQYLGISYSNAKDKWLPYRDVAAYTDHIPIAVDVQFSNSLLLTPEHPLPSTSEVQAVSTVSAFDIFATVPDTNSVADVNFDWDMLIKNLNNQLEVNKGYFEISNAALNTQGIDELFQPLLQGIILKVRYGGSKPITVPQADKLLLADCHCELLKLSEIPATVSFWIVQGKLELLLEATLNAAWKFSNGFPQMKDSEIDKLPLMSPVFHLATANAPVTAPLLPGFNLDVKLVFDRTHADKDSPGYRIFCQLFQDSTAPQNVVNLQGRIYQDPDKQGSLLMDLNGSLDNSQVSLTESSAYALKNTALRVIYHEDAHFGEGSSVITPETGIYISGELTIANKPLPLLIRFIAGELAIIAFGDAEHPLASLNDLTALFPGVGQSSDWLEKIPADIQKVLNAIALQYVAIVLEYDGESYPSIPFIEWQVGMKNVKIIDELTLDWLTARWLMASPFSGTTKECSCTLEAQLALGKNKDLVLDLSISSDSMAYATMTFKKGAKLCDFLAKFIDDTAFTSLLNTILPLELTYLEAKINLQQQSYVFIVQGFPLNAALVLTSEATFFCLALNLTEPVTIPLVGRGYFPLTKCQFIYASKTLSNDEVAAINSLIDLYDLQVPLPLNQGGGTQDFIYQGAQFVISIDPHIPPVVLPISTAKNTLEASTFVDAPMPSNVKSLPPQAKIWLPIQRSLGPLSIQRVGITYQDTKLWFLLDGMLTLGGFMATVNGLRLGFSLMEFNTPECQLDGFGIAYARPPLMMGGEFFKNNTDAKQTRYSGDVVVSTDAFSLMALGAYTQLKDYSSFFIFAHLSKPLGGPPYFYVTGLAGGYGYNQKLRLPNRDEVVAFPLLQWASDPTALSDVTDPMTVLELLEDKQAPWVSAYPGEQWLAVGLDATSFDLIQSKALFIAEFGRELQFALLGISRVQLPQASEANTSDALVFAEMGLDAVVQPSAGFFGISAQLSPNSYVLHPDCHLTGGFAFYTWYDKNQATGDDHSGDFVVTLGGYHPHFTRPAHYPDVPRLGFNWQVSNCVNISGQAYFALTPAYVMAGGALNVLFQAGDLCAWLDTYADFLMQWKPLHYEATAGVSVGVSYRLNLGLFSVTLKVELGADLDLWGPSLGGNVYVDWYVISFTIGFGADRAAHNDKISWSEFKTLLPKETTNVKNLTARSLAENVADEPSTTCINKIIIEQGLLHQQGNVWVVRPAELVLRTESAIPTTECHVTIDGNKVDIPSTEQPQDVSIKPMGLSNISSIHNVAIKSNSQAGKLPDVQKWAGTVQIVKRNVPKALWDKYTAGQDVTNDTATLPDRWTGVRIKAPAAQGKTSLAALNRKDEKSGLVDFPLQTTALRLFNSSSETISCKNIQGKAVDQLISSTLAEQTRVQARSNLATYLQTQGLFTLPKERYINSMERYASREVDLLADVTSPQVLNELT